jgi:DNA-directed RNA polymerase specialized sigma24 family protein
MTREECLSTIRVRLLRAWTYKVGHDLAEDIAQETLLLLETKYPEVTEPADLVRLSFTISTHVDQTMRRKMRVGRELPPPEGWNPPDPAAGQEYEVLLKGIRSRIGELTGRCPELLLLHLEGHTPEEIRDKMGALRTGTVYVWMHRCVDSLRRKLGLAGKA